MLSVPEPVVNGGMGPSKRGKPLLKDVTSPGTLSLLSAPVTGPEGVVDFGELKRHGPPLPDRGCRGCRQSRAANCSRNKGSQLVSVHVVGFDLFEVRGSRLLDVALLV